MVVRFGFLGPCVGFLFTQAVPGGEVAAAGHKARDGVLPQLVGAFLLADDVAVVPVDGNAGVRVYVRAQQVLCRPQDGPQNADGIWFLLALCTRSCRLPVYSVAVATLPSSKLYR